MTSPNFAIILAQNAPWPVIEALHECNSILGPVIEKSDYSYGMMRESINFNHDKPLVIESFQIIIGDDFKLPDISNAVNLRAKKFVNCKISFSSSMTSQQPTFGDCCFIKCLIQGMNLTNSNLQNCVFFDCKIKAFSFRAVSRTKFVSCDLSGSTFIGSHIEGCIMHDCDLSYSNLSDATINSLKMTSCRGIESIKGTPRCQSPTEDEISSPALSRVDRVFDWDKIRFIGQLPILAPPLLF